MTLGDLILGLRIRDPNTPVSEGFGAGHSDRGDYYNAAFKPVVNTTIGEMLAHAEAYQNQCELNSNAVDKLRRDKATLLWAISEFQNFPSERTKHALFSLANEVKE